MRQYRLSIVSWTSQAFQKIMNTLKWAITMDVRNQRVGDVDLNFGLTTAVDYCDEDMVAEGEDATLAPIDELSSVSSLSLYIHFLPYCHSKTLLLVFLRAVFDKTEGKTLQEFRCCMRAVDLFDFFLDWNSDQYQIGFRFLASNTGNHHN